MVTSALKPFFCFFGGKWRAAPHYPAPIHNEIIEPFAGAAGYATRHASRQITLVEKDPVIAALWRYLVAVSPSEIRALPIFTEGHIDDHNIAPEAKTLIGFWLNKGTTSPCKTPGRWMRDGNRPASFWGVEIRERIATQVRQIAHWQVIEGDYTDAPDREATYFVDPPYQRAGVAYRCSAAAIDFKSLGGWCLDREGQCIVCEQHGANWLPFSAHRSIKALEGKNGRAKSAEVLWYSEARLW